MEQSPAPVTMTPETDAVLCMGPETREVWHGVLGRTDLRVFMIETPPQGWGRQTAVTDPKWAVVARNIRETVQQLKDVLKDRRVTRLHVFANSPHSLGVLLSTELYDRLGRDREIIIYQREGRPPHPWAAWGSLGHAAAEPGTTALLTAPAPQNAAAAHVLVAINVLFQVQPAEVEPALKHLGDYEWLDIAGPRYINSPAEARRVAADIDELLRIELPRRYPQAELHVCYPGPLAALILGTSKLHVAARRITFYERIEVGNGSFRYAAVLRMPERRLLAGDEVIALSVVDEWFSKKGGISTFNRELCRALSRCGYRSLCYIEGGFSREEAEDARADGVKLLNELPEDAPDLIIGHDQISGEAALKLKRERYPRSRFALLIHTAPSETEWLKEGDDADRRARDKTTAQVELAAQADRVWGVGPLLTNNIRDTLRARRKSFAHVAELRPWLTEAEHADGEPLEPSLLLVGRPENVHWKGIDLALRAVAQLNPPRPPLVLRGAAPGTTTELKKKLALQPVTNKVRIQTFDDSEVRNADAFRGATVVLMPSRCEGFGLVGLEAIAFRVPVLVSSESGLGRVLKEIGTPAARLAIVDIDGDDEVDIPRWSTAIAEKLRRVPAAFAEAQQLYDDLRDKLNARVIVPEFVKLCMGRT